MIEGPIQINNTNLVFCYDAFSSKSYVGQPTTNLNNAISDYTGTGYSSDGEWISSEPTRFTKSYNSTIVTPIGNGATLCRESGTAGYHHLSRMGGGGESGAHSISCYVYPLSTITNFTIGMLNDGGNQVSFDLSTKVITYGGGIENRNAVCADVPGYPGWLRVGANIEGRYGGWVGCVGIATGGSYTPSTPYKAFYITGLQYETKTSPTAYTSPGSRSNTQGLLDLAGANTISLANAGFDSSSNLSFDGSNYYVTAYSISDSFWNAGSWTASAWVKFAAVSRSLDNAVFGHGVLGGNNGMHLAERNSRVYFGFYGNDIAGTIPLSANTWYHICWVFNYSTKLKQIYVNGVFDTSGGTVGYGGTGSNTEIGRYPWATSYLMNGSISTVALYSRVLSSTEILKNFNAQKSRYGL